MLNKVPKIVVAELSKEDNKYFSNYEKTFNTAKFDIQAKPGKHQITMGKSKIEIDVLAACSFHLHARMLKPQKSC
eukprot:14407647-Ditylum_brightwellii.AAC.1